MATPVLLQDSFAAGMRQDVPRDAIPKGGFYSAVDYIPEFGVPLMKRGGWARSASVLAAGTYVAAVGYLPTSGSGQVMFINNSGTLYTWNGSAMTSQGAAQVPAHTPTVYRAKAHICDAAGSSGPKTWDGTTLAALAGSPPAGKVSCAYKDHLVLASSAANLNRVWFSSAGDATSWNTAADGQWLDMTGNPSGLAALRNMIVVFSEGSTERITGDIIPGISGSDMRVEPLFPSIGCSDPSSIAAFGDYVVFANTEGVFMTDGVAYADLTAEGGIKNLWISLVGGGSSYNIAGAVHRGYYIVSVLDGSTLICAFMCDVKKRSWTRLTNLKALMIASTPAGVSTLVSNKCYFADRSSLYPGDVSTFFAPSGTYKNDGDGTAVTPVLELGYFRDKPGRKRFRRVLVSYYMTDAASDNPTLTVSYATDVATGSYTAISETLAEGTGLQRIELDINDVGEGIAFKIAQSNASGVTQIHKIEVDQLISERSR